MTQSPLGKATAILLALSALAPYAVSAHGFAGKRFFPTTLAIDDPFVSDELSVLYNHFISSGAKDAGKTLTNSFPFEYSKRITKHWGLSLGGEYLRVHPGGQRKETGLGNFELGTKVQFLTSDVHETIVSAGIGVELGNSGDAKVGAESFSVISPALFFGKGFGDLPESMAMLKPLAVTGALALNLPDQASIETEEGIERNPNTLSWGFAVQYNLNYLQSFVRDIQLGGVLNRMIPLLEFSLETCLDRGCEGDTTGTVDPGLIWFGKSLQLGLSAQIPVNNRTGNDIGVLALVHLFIDDLFPHTLGRPIFGGH